jgi:hypothetical protein
LSQAQAARTGALASNLPSWNGADLALALGVIVADVTRESRQFIGDTANSLVTQTGTTSAVIVAGLTETQTGWSRALPGDFSGWHGTDQAAALGMVRADVPHLARAIGHTSRSFSSVTQARAALPVVHAELSKFPIGGFGVVRQKVRLLSNDFIHRRTLDVGPEVYS